MGKASIDFTCPCGKGRVVWVNEDTTYRCPTCGFETVLWGKVGDEIKIIPKVDPQKS